MKNIRMTFLPYLIVSGFIGHSAQGRGLDNVVQEAKSKAAEATTQTPPTQLPGFESAPETIESQTPPADSNQAETQDKETPEDQNLEAAEEDMTEQEQPTQTAVEAKKEAVELNDPATDLSVHTAFGLHRIMRSKVSGELYSGGASSLAIGWVLRDDKLFHLLAIGRYQPVPVTGQISGVEIEGTLHQYWFGVEQKRPIFGLRFNQSLEFGISQMQMISVDSAQKTPDAAKKLGVLLAYQAGTEHFISGERLSVGWNARVAGFQTQSFAINFMTKWYL